MCDRWNPSAGIGVDWRCHIAACACLPACLHVCTVSEASAFIVTTVDRCRIGCINVPGCSATTYRVRRLFTVGGIVHDNCMKGDRDSSVGIAIHYRLDGPGSNSGGGEIFRSLPDRPWGPPGLLYNTHRVIPGGRAAAAWR